MGEDIVLELKLFLRLNMRHPMRFLIMLYLYWRKLNVTSLNVKFWLIELTELARVMLKSNSKKLCKSIIVRFSTFRHRTKFYRSRSKLKNNVKVKLDLKKRRCTIFTKAIEMTKQSNVVAYVTVDINCRLKVVFKNGRSKFFTDGDSLKRAIEKKKVINSV